MRVKFIKAWQTYRVGNIIEPAAMLRNWLMGNGYVERVEEETETAAAVPETAVVGAETAIIGRAKKRKRGRPRKAAATVEA